MFGVPSIIVANVHLVYCSPLTTKHRPTTPSLTKLTGLALAVKPYFEWTHVAMEAAQHIARVTTEKKNTHYAHESHNARRVSAGVNVPCRKASGLRAVEF
jgi:hypothetical protein